MKTNVNMTKAFYTRRNFVWMQIRKYPCSVCGKGVGRNSVQSTKRQQWEHKKCSGVHGSLTRKKDFSLEKCISGVLLQDEDKMINLDGDNIKAVDRFFYRGNVLSMEGVAQEAVTSRMEKIWRDFESYMRKKHIVESLRKLIRKLCEKCFNLWSWMLGIQSGRRKEVKDYRNKNVPHDMWENFER